MSSDSESNSILSLDSAFTPISDVPIQSVNPPSPPAAPPAEPEQPQVEESSSVPDSDGWKGEYDARLATWRAESAEARAKAEANRARWEELRASGQVPEHELWESGPSPADARDLVSGESHGKQGAQTLAQDAVGYPSSAASIQTLGETSDASPVHLSGAELSANEGANQWEEIPSAASSFPSLPERHNANSIPLQPTYKPRQAPHKREKEKEKERSHHKHPPAPAAPPSLTLTIFDSNVPARTRVLALVSSVAINMFLPFVNGVMLGFGEIFARNVVGPWFGWPRPVAASVGIRAVPSKPRRNTTGDPFS